MAPLDLRICTVEYRGPDERREHPGGEVSPFGDRKEPQESPAHFHVRGLCRDCMREHHNRTGGSGRRSRGGGTLARTSCRRHGAVGQRDTEFDAESET